MHDCERKVGKVRYKLKKIPTKYKYTKMCLPSPSPHNTTNKYKYNVYRSNKMLKKCVRVCGRVGRSSLTFHHYQKLVLKIDTNNDYNKHAEKHHF